VSGSVQDSKVKFPYTRDSFRPSVPLYLQLHAFYEAGVQGIVGFVKVSSHRQTFKV
jgi:hypothetical protein